MRGHALSTTRKLNRHWQSGGKISLPPWWNMGVYDGILYYLAPFYKWPSIASIVDRNGMRYIDTNMYTSLMTPAITAGRTGDIYISNEYELIPSVGIKADTTFDLYFYRNDTRERRICDIAGDEQIPLIIPVYDFVLMRIQNDEDVDCMDIKTMAEEFAAYIPGSPTMPEGFSPNVQTIALPPIYNGTPEVYDYYSGSSAASARVRRGIEKHFNVNASGSQWLDVTRIRWGEISDTVTGTYPTVGNQRLITTAQGTSNYQRMLTYVTIDSGYMYSDWGYCMPTQVEPPTDYEFYTTPDTITGANFGMAAYFSASHSQNRDTYDFEINGTPYSEGYWNLYNGCLAPYNFQCAWRPRTEQYTYAYMSRLKRFILKRQVING